MENFEELYEVLGKKVYAYLYSRTLNMHMAEELTQETFYQLLRSSHRFQGNSTVSTWVFSIANNVLGKAFRAKKYEKQLVAQLGDNLSSSSVDIEGQTIEKCDQEQLYMTIQTLDEPQREIVCLRIYGELSFGEIGDIFKKSENWARVNFQRAKVKISKKVGEEKR